MAVGDAAAGGRNVDHALEAGAPLVAEEFVVEGLQVERTADQHEEGAEQCHQHQALSPLRQALGEQRALAELDGFHHRLISPAARRRK
jgi:hypothetical protein